MQAAVAPDPRKNDDRYSVIGPGGRRTVDEWGNRFNGPSKSNAVTRQPVMTGFESPNRYRVINEQKDQIFFTVEESTVKERAGGGYRALRLHVMDSNKQEVMRMSKEYECCACCRTFDDGVDRTGSHLKIECPPGNVAGYVKQESNGLCIAAHYTLNDASDTPFLFIDSPRCTCDCPCNDVILKISNVDSGEEVGFMKKKGSVMDTYVDADIFQGYFPKDLDVMKKAVLLGGMFLVDYLHFERGGGKHGSQW